MEIRPRRYGVYPLQRDRRPSARRGWKRGALWVEIDPRLAAAGATAAICSRNCCAGKRRPGPQGGDPVHRAPARRRRRPGAGGQVRFPPRRYPAGAAARARPVGGGALPRIPGRPPGPGRLLHRRHLRQRPRHGISLPSGGAVGPGAGAGHPARGPWRPPTRGWRRPGWRASAGPSRHDHARLGELAAAGSADCVLFNFGWLPGADHGVHSTAAGSVTALQAALAAAQAPGRAGRRALQRAGHRRRRKAGRPGLFPLAAADASTPCWSATLPTGPTPRPCPVSC